MNYTFDVEVANKYGVEEAIFISNLQYWILQNKANERNYYDGHTWTFNSNSAFIELFPFWSQKQVRRIIESLKEKGVIITGNYNKNPYDRTLWYAFVDEGKWIGHKGQMDLPKWANGFSEKGEPIPDNKPDNKQNIEKEIYKEKEKVLIEEGKFYVDDTEKYSPGWSDLAKQLTEKDRLNVWKYIMNKFEYQSLTVKSIRKIIENYINNYKGGEYGKEEYQGC